MNEAFLKRVKKLLKADLKPRFVIALETGEITSGIATPEWLAGDIGIGSGAFFFTDIELPSKKAIMLKNVPEPEFAKSLYEIAGYLTKFARVASFGNQRGEFVDWAIQFETDKDLQIGLKHFMQREQEYAICIAYAPNQEKQS